MNIEKLLESLWQDYTELNPHSQSIHDLFISAGEKHISNDHVAFRTFNHQRVNLEVFSKYFTKLGYEDKGEYHFKEKKLFARHFEHSDSDLPKIFISEILLENFSSKAQTIVKDIIAQIPEKSLEETSFVHSARHWDITHETYQELFKESEYLAWLYVFGFRANHFTVLVNNLSQFKNLKEVNTFLKGKDIKLNLSGGEIKGSKEVFLEQSSTLSFNKEITFSDGKFIIPTTYYEFAQRHPLPNDQLYTGFVSTSADKIFESTSKGQ